MTTKKPTRVELECGHELWFSHHVPELQEHLWCPRCQRDEPQSPGTAAVPGAWSYQEDFRSKRIGMTNYYEGECTFEKCVERWPKVFGWRKLRGLAHQHYMQRHTARGSTIVITEGARYPKGSPPPF